MFKWYFDLPLNIFCNKLWNFSHTSKSVYALDKRSDLDSKRKATLNDSDSIKFRNKEIRLNEFQ